MVKLAVTGATGFAGSFFLKAIANEHCVVKSLARKPQFASTPQLEWIAGDLFQHGALNELCAGADCVLHIAGAIAAASRNEFFRINAQGTANVLEAAKRAGVKRFVYVSSLTARKPDVSHYAASKHEAESILQTAPHGMQLLILRPCAVYGEGDTATLPLIKLLLSRTALVPGASDAKFSMIHAADLARVFCQAITSPIIGVREVDDGAGGYRWADLAAITRRHFGSPTTLHFIPRSVASAVAAAASGFSRLTGNPPFISQGTVAQLYGKDWVTSAPGWPLASPLTLEQGLLRAIAGYRAAGILPKQPPLATPPQDFET